MKTIETSAEKDMHQIDNLVKKIQILQESVSDASIFLPAYDSKKCQQTLNDLNNKYQVNRVQNGTPIVIHDIYRISWKKSNPRRNLVLKIANKKPRFLISAA